MKALCLSLIMLLVSACGRNGFIYNNDQPEQPTYSNPNVQLKELNADICGGFAADILWVVDNSGSMSQEQQDIIQNTSFFINEFAVQAQINWRMGLISTDKDESPYLGFQNNGRFEKGNPDPVGTFQNAVGQLGTSGSADERSMDSIMAQFQRDPNFVRNSACLVMILVSDEPDHSKNFSAPAFLKEMEKLKGNLKAVRIFTVLATNENGCDTGENYDYAGSSYETIVNATKGGNYDVCNSNFGAQLADIGRKIVELVANSKLLLPNVPIIDTLRVTYKGVELPEGEQEDGGVWYYDPVQNAIVFYDLGFAPDDDEKVKIEFDIDDGIQRK